MTFASYDYDADIPDDIKAIMAKVPGRDRPKRAPRCKRTRTRGSKLLWQLGGPRLADLCRRDSIRPARLVAAAGGDGIVRLVDAEFGSDHKQFSPAPIHGRRHGACQRPPDNCSASFEPVSTRSVAGRGKDRAGSKCSRKTIVLTGRSDYVQLLVTGTARLGRNVGCDADRRDGTLEWDRRSNGDRPGAGEKPTDRARLTLALGGQSMSVPVSVSGLSAAACPDFVHDVAPVLSKLGCNAGHVSRIGKGQERLQAELRGYDPLFDVRALTDDLAGAARQSWLRPTTA